MKKFILLAFCFLGLFCFKGNASHVVGSELTYSCTATPGVFKVTLIVYKQCGSGSAELCSNCTTCTLVPAVSITGADASCQGTGFGTVAMSLVKLSEVHEDLMRDCPLLKTKCLLVGCKPTSEVGTEDAVERYEFTGQVNLGTSSGIPVNCCKVSLSWSNCCRNGQITTGAANANFYTETVINRCAAAQTPCNSAPVFKTNGTFTLCKGEPAILNAGAVDPDGDSLSYGFAPSLAAAGTPVNYAGGFSYDQPMPYRAPQGGPPPAGIYCDSRTGLITFTPDFIDIGVVAVEVKQWRTINGIPTVIGTTRKEFQCVVKNCPPNNPPKIKSTIVSDSLTSTMVVYVTPGTQLCFNIVVGDQDSVTIKDTTRINNWFADQAIVDGGGTMVPNYDSLTRKINGPREDSYKFCWTPQAAQVRSNPYILWIDGKDSRCPNPGTTSKAYLIYVSNGPTVNINKAYGCDFVNLGHTSSLTVISRQWKISKTAGIYDAANLATYGTATVKHFVDQPGNYPFQLMVTTAQGTATILDTLKVTKVLKLTGIFPDTLFCKPAGVPVQLYAVTNAPSSDIKWTRVGDTASLGNTAVLTTNTRYGTTDYMITVKDPAINCTLTQTGRVSVYNPVAAFTVNKFVQCSKGNSFVFTNQSKDSGTTSLTYQWYTNSDTLTAISFSRSVPAAGQHTFKLVATSGGVCKDSISKTITVLQTPVIGYAVNKATQCLPGNEYRFINQSVGDTVSYLWRMGNNVTNNNQDSVIYSYPATGTFTSRLIGTAANGCKDSLSKTMQVNPAPVSGFTIDDSTQCFKGSSFNLTNNSTNNGSVFSSRTWDLGDGTQFSSVHITSKKYLADGVYQVKLVTRATNGCQDSIIKNIYVYPSPVAAFVSDTTVKCLKTAFSFTNNSTISSGTFTQLWSFGNGNASVAHSPLYTYTGAGDFNVKLAVLSGLGCPDSITKQVKVLNGPIAGFGVSDPMPCLEQKVILTNSTDTRGLPLTYKWYFNDVQDTFSNHAFITYHQPGLYTVKLSAVSAGGCNDSISKAVVVRPMPVVNIAGSNTGKWGDTNQYIVQFNQGSVWYWNNDGGTIIGSRTKDTFSLSWHSNITDGAVWVYETDTAGCVSETDTIHVMLGGNVATDEPDMFRKLSVYPNPASTVLYIDYELKNAGPLEVRLINAIGQEVVSQNMESRAGFMHHTIDLAALASGIYLCELRSSNGVVLKKVIVTK